MHQLRGSLPKPNQGRLKLLMYSPAKVGKTTACLQMQNGYLIDTEAGAEHDDYIELARKSGSVMFQTNVYDEVIEEIRALSTVNHDFKTLSIDSFTPLYDDLLETGAKFVGEDFGRHYGWANRRMKRLYNLLSQIDMNIIVTCHSKHLYGTKMEVIGETFDGWRKLDYLFDLVLYLERDSKGKRWAIVKGTRLKEFPDQSRFEWSYKNLVERYGVEKLERIANPVDLASAETITTFKTLYNRIGDGDKDRLGISRVIQTVEEVADLPEDRLKKGIALMEKHLTPRNGKAIVTRN